MNEIATQLSLKDINKSLEYAEQAMEIARKISFAKGEAESYCVLCAISAQQGQFSVTLERCRQGEMIYENLNFKPGMANAFNRTGTVYILQGEYALALENFFKSLKLWQELKQKGIHPSR